MRSPEDISNELKRRTFLTSLDTRIEEPLISLKIRLNFYRYGSEI